MLDGGRTAGGRLAAVDSDGMSMIVGMGSEYRSIGVGTVFSVRTKQNTHS